MDFDFYNVGKTLIIACIVILITAILFYFIWLKHHHVSIPLTFGCYEYNFPSNMGYYSKLRILLIDFANHQYWITHVGLEGELISVLLPDVATRFLHRAFHLLFHIRYGLNRLLLGPKSDGGGQRTNRHREHR